MSHTPLAAPGKDDLRLAPALNLLWADAAASDVAASGQAATLLQAAAHAAAARWPDVYHEPTRTRLVFRGDDAPPAAVLEAAAKAGLEVDASGGGAAICDAALTSGLDFSKIPTSLPALVAEAGAPLRFAASSARSTLGDLPLVVMPTTTSPGCANASTSSFEKTNPS